MQSTGQDPLPPTGAAPRLGAAALLMGLAALVAQALWIRALGRAVGTTSEALATVAAVFLGGLALGATWGGRRAARSPDPAWLAARCLLGAGVLILISPWLFALLPQAHLLLLDLLGLLPGASPLPTLVLVLPLLLVPTLLMGAAFPLLVAAQPPALARTGRRVGRLYALNTLGATLGVPLAALGLWLLGERLTLAAAAAAQVVAALTLRGVAARAGAAAADGATPAPGAVDPLPTSERGVPRALLAALALTGALGLAAEVAAFRLLEPLTGAHLWGLVLLLVPVLGGIALGGVSGGWIADRTADPRRALATALVAAGALLALAPAVAGLLPAQLLSLGYPAPLLRVGLLALGATLVLLPPMLCLGACLPLAVKAAAAQGVAPARAVGDLAGWNAAGSMLGGLLAGFVLLPAWGAPVGLLALAALALAAGPWLRLGRGRAAGLVVSALPLFVLVVPAVRERLLAAAPSLPEIVSVTTHRPPIVRRAGAEPYVLALHDRQDAALYAEWFGGRPVQPAGRSGGAVAAREGRHGTVALLEEPGGDVRLRVQGRSEARFHPDDPDRASLTEVALGLLPMLAHPAPQRALVVGHGAGWTVEAVLAAGAAEVDVAELDAALLAAVQAWRGHPLEARSDPRARIHLTDGRLLLRRAARTPEQRYDVIASQPSHPWIPGAGHLFTREAYALAREALTERGVFAQWLNLFEMSPDLLRRALVTFRSAFPRCWLFLFEGEVVLLGFAGEAVLDGARWTSMLTEDARVRAVAGPAGLADAGDLWCHFALDAAGLARLAPATEHEPISDDQPALELGLAARVLTQADEAVGERTPTEALATAIGAHFPPDFAAAMPDRAARQRLTADAVAAWLRRGALDAARLWEQRAPWGADGHAVRVRATLARARGDFDAAEVLLRAFAHEHPDDGTAIAAWLESMAAGLPGRPDLASAALADSAPLALRHAGDGRVRAAQARLHQVAGDTREARAHYQAALLAVDPPAPPGTGAAFGRLLIALGPEAGQAGPTFPDLGPEGYALEMLRGDPMSLVERGPLELFTRMERRLGDPERAAALEAALEELNRASALVERRAAWAWLPRAAPQALVRAEKAVWLDPTSVEGWELLALARLQAGVRSGEDAARRAAEAAARDALAEAWRLAPDRERQGQRGAAYLRWFGAAPIDPAQADR